MTREEAIQMLKEWHEEMNICGVPEWSAKLKALDMAISALHFEADCRSCMWREKYEELTEPSDLMSHEEAWNTIESDLISREDLLKKAEKGNITKYSTNSVNIITTDVVTVENIKKAPSADTPTTEVKKPTNTPTDLISRADAVAYPLGFDHYDKENGSREFICGVESYREYIQHLPSVKATENKYDCDLISREKAIESAEVHCTTDGAYGYMDIKSIVDMLESLPSVSADRPTVVHCRECVRKKNCWMFDEHKDDNGTCVWAEPYYITESPNDVDETDDEVIEPSDIISRADAKKEVYLLGKNPSINEIWDCLDALPSADAEPKWNCTANFVAEQLDRLRNMTDEERWDFFIKFFSPSADIQTEDYSDLPDIPRAYYEKIVGNMSHEINMLKQQLEDRPMVHSERPAEWIKEIEGNGWNEWENITCSHCGAKVEKVKYLGGGKRWNYCPNCGSYMKGGAE